MSSLFSSNKRSKFSYDNAIFLCDLIRRLKKDVCQEDAGREASPEVAPMLRPPPPASSPSTSSAPTAVAVHRDTVSPVIPIPMVKPEDVVPTLVEALREFAEVIVWGDKHDESVYFVFLEKNMMQTLKEMALSEHSPSEVKVQVLQSVTILLQNLSSQQSVFSVCSNNHINRMMQLYVDPDDEELQSNYVSFLKTLCLRLNSSSVQFFFQMRPMSPTAAKSEKKKPNFDVATTVSSNTTDVVSSDASDTEGEPLMRPDDDEGNDAFPLFSCAVRLLSSDDSLVRTAARQIIITVLQLQDNEVTLFLKKKMLHVFRSLASWIVQQMLWVESRLKSRDTKQSGTPWATLGAMDHRMEDLIDDLYYFNDVFAVPQDYTTPILLDVLGRDVIDGVLMRSIDARLSHDGDDGQSAENTVRMELALHMIAQWLKVNTVPEIHCLLVNRLFLEAPDKSQCPVSESRIVHILTTESLLSCHVATLGVVQGVWCSKLTDGVQRAKLCGIDETDESGQNKLTDDAFALPLRDVSLPEVCDWPSIRSTLGEYTLALQRGAKLEFSVDKQSLLGNLGAPSSSSEGEASSNISTTLPPLIHAMATSIRFQASRTELLRLSGFVFTLSVYLTVGSASGMDAQTLCAPLRVASCGAQLNLLHRVELYRQHLWMLYGGSGENSLLTPSSLLCQLLNSESDREIADPFEVLFARIERDIPSVISSFAVNVQTSMAGLNGVKLGRDVAFVAPLMPALSCWQAHLASYLSSSIRTADTHASWYLDVQQRANSNVPLERRCPQDEDEIEYAEVAVWLILRHVIFVQFCGVSADPLMKCMQQFACRRRPRTEVRAWELASSVETPGIRCEYAPESEFVMVESNPNIVAGTTLFLFVEGSDVFLIEPSRESPDNQGTIAYALRALYCEAHIHSKQLFKLSIVQDAPLSRQRICIVVRDRTVCQQLAQTIHRRAASLKHDASALIWKVLSDEPLRQVQQVFCRSH